MLPLSGSELIPLISSSSAYDKVTVQDISSQFPFVATGGSNPISPSNRAAEWILCDDYLLGSDTDDTASILRAIAAAQSTGKGVRLNGRQYTISQTLQMPSGITFCGQGRNNTSILLANGSNTSIITGVLDVSNLKISGMKLIGNAGGQTLGVISRGIYLVGLCDSLFFEDIWIYNALDHGMSLSNGSNSAAVCGSNSVFLRLFAQNCGSAAQSGAGGPGGTGLGGGTDTTTWVGCGGTGNWLNAIKASSGYFLHCYGYSNNGGGFETGFNTNASTKGATYIACDAISNGGDGFRHQGQGVDLTMIGCTAKYNGSNGVTFLGPFNGAIVDGCRFCGNGTSGTRVANQSGLDGVGIISNLSFPTGITISNTKCYDDQNTATQNYGLYLDAGVSDVQLGGGNNFNVAAFPNKIGPKFYGDSTSAVNIPSGPDERGNSGNFCTVATATVTGTTSATNMLTHDILGIDRHIGGAWRAVGGGTVTGTNSTKLIKVVFYDGASVLFSSIISNQIAATAASWSFEVEFEQITSTAVVVRIVGATAGQTPAPYTTTRVSYPAADTLTFAIACTLGNGADSATQDYMFITAVK